MFKHAIVCCARWETPYIGEWIRYYDAIGFDRIYLYCNDDDPAELAAEVERTPKSRPDLVVFVHYAGQGQQRAMYIDAMKRVRREALWVSFLDVDEFLYLPQCNNIKDFMVAWEGMVDSVHFQWINFGNSGFVKRPLGSVLAQYTRRDHYIHNNTKHISRVSRLDEDRIARGHHPFWHGLFDPIWSNLKRVTVLGDDIAELVVDLPKHLRSYLDDPDVKSRILDVGVINHYMMKSEEDFNIRVARGLGGEFSGQKTWQVQYANGNHRGILQAMNSAADTRLREFAIARGLTTGPLVQAAEPVVVMAMTGQPDESVRNIHVHHALWSADLILGKNGRARHATQGTLASYRFVGDVLHVHWDDWPSESFIKRGEEYVPFVPGGTAGGRHA